MMTFSFGRDLSLFILGAALATTIIPTNSQAQTYYGMTALGGTYNEGVIYSMTQAGTFSKIHEMQRVDGAGPKGNLLKASDGKYYGVTELGGSNGLGTLFRYDPLTGVFTILRNLSVADGTKPVSGLVQAGNGELVGVCSEGGANNMGTLFEYNIGTSTFSVRSTFDGVAKGRRPLGRLWKNVNNANKIYGTTLQGGTGSGLGTGVLFEYDASTNAFVKRFDFATAADGILPFSGVTQVGNQLFGTTQFGGSSNKGTVYSYNLSTNTHTKLKDFNALDGEAPIGGLVQASNGLLYGVASEGGSFGGGAIYTINTTGTTFAVVYHFDPAVSGYKPFGTLIPAASGVLYGTTKQGGTNDQGKLFSIAPTTNIVTILESLGDSGLGDVWGSLLEDPAGTMVGMARTGGEGNAGALFSYNVLLDQVDELISFGLKEASQPKGRLAYGPNGMLYGLASSGGANNEGVLFSIDPNTNVFTRHFSFGGLNGSFPSGTLLLVGNKFYGLCEQGGSSGNGVIFEYDPGSDLFVKKQDLNLTIGASPKGSFLQATNGLLYTVTAAGGTSSNGTLIQYNATTNSVNKLHDLTTTDGQLPSGDLMQASDGLIYGTCREGGAFGDGSLFTYDIAGASFNVLYSFNLFQGSGPSGQLIEALDGKIYGTTSEGGNFLSGGIYYWNRDSTLYNQWFDLQTTQGVTSLSNLVQDSDSLLWGTCLQGGTGDNGTIFKFRPRTATFTLLKQFSNTLDGKNPFNGLTAPIAPTAGVSMAIRIVLEGPFNSGTGLMNDAIRALAQFPLTEPYTGSGFTHVGEGGGETIDASVLAVTGNNAIVDWVYVELRDKNNSSTVLNTRSALVQRDGDVVDLDGISPLVMTMPDDNYFVAVRHRNHLGIMTLNVVALSGTTTNLDLSSSATLTFGTEARKNISGTQAMWAGNVFTDDRIKYTGGSNDRDPILVKIGGSIPTNTVVDYDTEDVNLDGTIKYTGANNDRDPILVNIGGSVPTNTRLQQLP